MGDWHKVRNARRTSTIVSLLHHSAALTAARCCRSAPCCVLRSTSQLGPNLPLTSASLSLQLNDNEITSIPSAYGKLKKLERLDVSPSRADRCPLRCSVNADRASLLA